MASLIGRALANVATLTVEPSTDNPFVRPSKAITEPSQANVVHGNATLTLKKVTKIARLVVNWTGDAKIYNGSQFTTGRIWEQEHVLVSESAHFEAGEHRLPFMLTFPSSLAVFERNRHGIVPYFLSATATSVGLLNNTLKAEIPFGIQAINDDSDVPVPPLELAIEHHVESLGPLRIVIRCVTLIVGAAVLTELVFAEPPDDITILSVSLFIHQSYQLLPFGAAEPYLPPTDRIRVYRLDGRQAPSECGAEPGTPHLSTLKRGEAKTIRHLDRLPDRNGLSASTLHGTETPLRTAHEIELEVDFETASRHRQRASVHRPITVFSCACLALNMLVPEYIEDEVEVKLTKTGPTRANRFSLNLCNCELSKEQVIAQNRDQLLAKSLPQDAVRDAWPKQV